MIDFHSVDNTICRPKFKLAASSDWNKAETSELFILTAPVSGQNREGKVQTLAQRFWNCVYWILFTSKCHRYHVLSSVDRYANSFVSIFVLQFKLNKTWNGSMFHWCVDFGKSNRLYFIRTDCKRRMSHLL